MIIKKHRCDTLEALKSKLVKIESETHTWSSERVKQFYAYVFKLFKDSSQSRAIDAQIAARLLMCISALRKSCFLERFVMFLCDSSVHKCINLDQWKIFIDFSATIKPDFSNYDVSDACK